MWSRGSDRFIGVRFATIGTFDILWESLQVIDKEYLADAKVRDKRKWELLENAMNVIRTTGPQGGFKYLSYEYLNEDGTPSHVSNGSRKAAEKLIEFFRSHGIEIREERLK